MSKIIKLASSKQHLRDLFNIKARQSSTTHDRFSFTSDDFPSLDEPILRETNVNTDPNSRKSSLTEERHDSEVILI